MKLDCKPIQIGDGDYPGGLGVALGATAPTQFEAAGNREILCPQKLALFCSARCPGDLILKAYELAKKLRDEGATVISGFHSPVEKECLRILLRGKQPVIICPGRSLTNLRLPGDWKAPLESGRLLLLSPFCAKHRRVTADLAKRRNEIVVAIADRVSFIYVSPGGELAAIRELARQWAKPIVEP